MTLATPSPEATLDDIRVRCHTLQFLFLFQVPPEMVGRRDGRPSLLAERVERQGSLWRKPQLHPDGLDSTTLRRWEEGTERLLPEVLRYLFPFVAEQAPVYRLLEASVQRESHVYQLDKRFLDAWGTARKLAPFRMDAVGKYGFPEVEFCPGLAAWLYLFEAGQVALRLSVDLSGKETGGPSLLSCLRFMDLFGSLDPTSYPCKIGRFLFELPPNQMPGQAADAAKHEAGKFGSLALINFLLADLLEDPTARPASDRAILSELTRIEGEVKAWLGHSSDRESGATPPPLLRLGKELASYDHTDAESGGGESFPVWFNLDRLHRFCYLDLEGTPSESLLDQCLRWVEQGHSIAYLARTARKPPRRLLEIFPHDRCAGNSSTFLGFQCGPDRAKTDTTAVDQRLGQEVFSGFFLAAHQRQLVLGLSLQCTHEAGRRRSCGVCDAGEDLDLLADRLRDLRYRFLNCQVNAMFSEVSVYPPLQRAYEFFMDAMNVRRASEELRGQLKDLQTFLQVQRNQQQALRERQRDEMFREQARLQEERDREHKQREEKQSQREQTFNRAAAVLAALAIPATVITGLYGTNHFKWDESPTWQLLFIPLLLVGFLGTGLAMSRAELLLGWWEHWFGSKDSEKEEGRRVQT